MFVLPVMLALAAASVPPGLPPSADDLAQLERFSRCVVRGNPKAAAAAIDVDFTTPDSETRLRALSRDRNGCLGRGRLRFGSVLLRGFIAEELLDRDLTATDPVAAMGYRPSRPPVVARTQSEAIALCLVRARPAEVWTLFGLSPGGTDEAAAIRSLIPPTAACTAPGVQARFNRPGLRAILALAFRRLVENNKG